MTSPIQGRRPRLRVPTEVALVVVSAATVVGLGPLFTGRSYLAPLLLVVGAAHVVNFGGRALRQGLVVVAAVSSIAFILVATWVLEPATTRYGLPTFATWHAASADLADGWTRFQAVVAPARPATGLLLAAAGALWVAVFLADWAAFRLAAPFEAVIPTSGLFLFAAVLGSDRERLTTAVFLVAVLAFLLLSRVARQETTVRWIASGTGRGTRSMLVTGTCMAATAILVGFAAGPLLPGARDPALVALSGHGSGRVPRVTLSPLVDIKARLIDQAAVEVFTVRSPVAAYWRLTSLDRFDGELWSSGGSFEAAGGALPNGASPDRASRQVEQRFDIAALSTIWLPAAFEPSSIDAGDLDVRWEPASSTLIVDADRATSDDTSYRVTSSVPELVAAELRQAPSPPREIATRYTALPRGLSAGARRTAEEIVAGTTTAYDKAIALQSFFRDNFTYSTEVPSGHSGNAIDTFLARRLGFCEQFAGTFAAMARSVGLPSRVAVGFTPGRQDPADPELFHVLGKHAHAWPEVFLTGFGWVGFEPTPGRGAPGAEAYTGVQPDQATPSAAAAAPAPAATAVPGSSGATGRGSTSMTTPSTTTPATADPARARPWPEWLAAGLLAILALAAAYVMAVTVAFWAHRGLRILTARRGPTERTRAAWLDAGDALATVGLIADPSETPLEFSTRVDRRLETAGAEHRSLAMAATAARYADGGVTDAVARQATADAGAVIAGVRRRVPVRRRVAGWLGWRWSARRQSSRRKRSRIR